MELHDAIKQITNQFGKNVLTEERFVNILADVYPNRDNRAVLGILRTLVKDGYCSDLLACNKNNVKTFVGKSSLNLNKKYGYDKTLVEEILNSLAIACDLVVPKHIIQPVSTPVPHRQIIQEPAKPQKQQLPKPVTEKIKNQKPKQQPIPPKQQKTRSEKTKGIALLALSFFGLFFGTFIYVLYLTYSWWMLFTILLIIIVHLLTFSPGFSLYDYKNKTYSRVFTGVLLFAFLNYLAPLFFSTDFIEENFTYYWGRMHLDGTEGIIFPICIFFFLSIFFVGADKKSFLEIIEKKEFIITVSGLALIYVLFLFIPELDKQIAKKHIYAEVSKIESLSEKLKEQRANEARNLQFKGIELLSTRRDFMNTIMRDSNFTIRETYANKGVYISSELKLPYAGTEYRDVIESVVCCDVKWDNKELTTKTYFVDDSVIAISISDKKYGNYDCMGLNEILSMYTQKYGDPEMTFGNGFYTTYYMIDRNYRPSFRNESLKDSSFVENLIYRYNWTYKNGGIEIRRENYPSYSESLSISYVSSILMEKYRNYIKKVEKQKTIRKKQKTDSLNQARIEQEKKEKQNQVQREKEHRKSVEQI